MTTKDYPILDTYNVIHNLTLYHLEHHRGKWILYPVVYHVYDFHTLRIFY